MSSFCSVIISGEFLINFIHRQAKLLQESLLALLDRVDKVREEHDKLEGENKFLQDYIGHLMQTSKITGSRGIKSTGGAGGRAK